MRQVVAGIIMLAFLFIHAVFPTIVFAAETLPWGIERIGANCVWDKDLDMTVDQNANAGQYTGYNENVTVAVIDSGVDTDHPDLEDRIIGGINFWQDGNDIRNNTDYEDREGHGTCVAGIIAAMDNEEGVIGVAPKVMMYIIRLASETQRCLAYAIDHAVMAGCKIISISMGWSYSTDRLLEACRDAYLDGVLVVAAAGNENLTNGICYPAKYDDYVLAVGATDKNDARWTYPPLNYGSNMGPELDLMAPGEEIYTTALNGGYGNFDMTSAATPHVSGVLALMWAGRLDDDWDWFSGGTWNVDELEIKLETKALDLGQPWKDDEFGFGLVNAWRACQVPEGDLNDSFNVDLFDVVIVARAFGSQPNETEWNPVANINIDKYINIFDIVIIALNFGKVDLP